MINPQLVSQSPPSEQQIILHGVTWQQYESLLNILGEDFPTLRLNYLQGTLEIMTNSPEHEAFKKMIAMLIEAYLQEKGIRFYAGGSTTFRQGEQLRGLEPDECYYLGEEKPFPDLAVEVVITSTLLNKLEIYQGLGVQEVWLWQQEQFSIYHLRSRGYEQISSSELLPDLDINLLARSVKPKEQFDAIMAFRQAIRE